MTSVQDKSSRTVLKASVAVMLVAAVFAAGAAHGAGGGGGGGGGAPSASASGVDPAKRYAEGVAYLKDNKHKQAEKAFGDVLEVVQRDPNTNYMMALAQIGQEDWKSARKYLRSAVKYDGKMAVARGWLGSIEAKLGDAAKAQEQKAALDGMKAACADTCANAAEINEAVARVDAALAAPAAMLSPSGDVAKLATAGEGDAAYLAASGLINEGRYEDALGSLDSAARVFGPHPDVLTYQGFANRKLGRFETALGYYSAALKLQPDHRGANEYLGEYYVETGDLDRARSQLKTLDGICKFGCEEAEELRRWIASAS